MSTGAKFQIALIPALPWSQPLLGPPLRHGNNSDIDVLTLNKGFQFINIHNFVIAQS